MANWRQIESGWVYMVYVIVQTCHQAIRSEVFLERIASVLVQMGFEPQPLAHCTEVWHCATMSLSLGSL